MSEFYTVGYNTEYTEGPGLSIAPLAVGLEQLNEVAARQVDELTVIDDLCAAEGNEGVLVYKLVPYAHVFQDRVTLENAYDGDGIAVRALSGSQKDDAGGTE